MQRILVGIRILQRSDAVVVVVDRARMAFGMVDTVVDRAGTADRTAVELVVAGTVVDRSSWWLGIP